MSNHQDLQIFVLKLHKYEYNSLPLEVEDRGSETQPQVDEKLNRLT